MRLTVPAFAIAAVLSAPVLAQEDAAYEEMSCAEFAALDAERQEGAAASLGRAAGKDADPPASEVLAACEDAPDGLALDALTGAGAN